MAVVAPSTDPPGAALMAQVAVAQSLVTANANPPVLYQNQQLLNMLQVEAVDHFMATGWLNAAYILQNYTPPAWDSTGQTILARVAFLQALVNNAPPPNPGAFDFTSVAASYAVLLYAKQVELVEHIMNFPGGTPAATMLANLTGFQSFPFEYTFNSVGFTDEWIDD